MIVVMNCFDVLMTAKFVNDVMIFEFDVFMLSFFFNHKKRTNLKKITRNVTNEIEIDS